MRQPCFKSRAVRALQMLIERLTQLLALTHEVEGSAQQRTRRCKRQQRKRLVVQQYPVVDRHSIRCDERAEQTIGAPVTGQKKADALGDGASGIPFPTK